jgi:hypothetical protein
MGMDTETGATPVLQDFGFQSGAFALIFPPVKLPSPSTVPTRVGIVSLGCAKNLVDAEIMLGALLQSGGVLKSVTSHTGRDYWSPAEADDMFTSCLAHAAATGVTVREGT